MFVIPCKFNRNYPYIIQLVDDIRSYHKDDKIVIVDSDSSDKSYFEDLKKYNVIIEDVKNRNWMIGAYWYAFNKYPNEEYYFFMHDSMRVKSNLNMYKNNELTILAYFNRNIGNYNGWSDMVKTITLYKDYSNIGSGVYGPIFFCKNIVMQKLKEKNVHLILPENKEGTWYSERAYGYFLEMEGYDLTKCSLYGDILELESHNGKSGPYPHKTSWQFPVEKFYASHKDINRL